MAGFERVKGYKKDFTRSVGDLRIELLVGKAKNGKGQFTAPFFMPNKLLK